MRTHEEKKLACDLCGQKFRLLQHLVQHKSCVHNDKRDFICYVCKAGFKLRGSMRQHVLRVHGQEALDLIDKPVGGVHKHMCSLCGVPFKTWKNLQAHVMKCMKKETHTSQASAGLQSSFIAQPRIFLSKSPIRTHRARTRTASARFAASASTALPA